MVTAYHSIPYASFPEWKDAELLPFTPGDYSQPHPERIALSVFTPDEETNSGRDLPVVVYVHGGGYINGTHTEADLSALASSGVVAVSVGYRLSLSGFAPFSDEEPFHFRGVDDVAVALEWVQNNIEYFGGDPTQVTLAGQSAGAGIALWLCRRDHYTGLFRQAWAHSPAFPRTSFEEKTGRLRTLVGKPLTRAGLSKANPRKVSWFTRSYPLDLALGPYPFDAAELAEVPIVVSSTDREVWNNPAAQKLDNALGRWLLRRGESVVGIDTMTSYLASKLDAGQENTERASSEGSTHRQTTVTKKTIVRDVLSDVFIRRWTSEVAEKAPGPVWVIGFKHAYHCDELPLMFGTHSLWTSAPDWPQFRPERQALSFDLETGERTLETDPLRSVRLYLR